MNESLLRSKLSAIGSQLSAIYLLIAHSGQLLQIRSASQIAARSGFDRTLEKIVGRRALGALGDTDVAVLDLPARKASIMVLSSGSSAARAVACSGSARR